ncbi:MAG: TetR family transcriptional regulator C-terminal domain-containing protein [Rhodobacterales bacterium]|nr:TetR family transcriptional regulator C-terminal domain-containing protein [Rhodobacterales bacterium]
MPAPLPHPDPLPRTQSRDVRRTQMIEATIETLAVRGFSRATLTEVAARARTSHGLVLFHFKSKDNLLAETLGYMAEEYRQNWQTALAAAGEAPESRIHAMAKADFNATICTPARLSAWCAYWGESQSRPLYQSRCGANDALYNDTLAGLCARMNACYGYAHDPDRAARLIRIMTEGVWLDLMTMERPYPIPEAFETVRMGIAALYPRHFPAEAGG